nr:NlpC/P60 family protein [Fertoeibacter niger]
MAFGRSRAGCDCWGLACVIHAELTGIRLPDYLGYGSVDEHAEIAALIGGAQASPLWRPVSLDEAQALDVVVFRRGRHATHIGVVIRPGLMIHMADEDCAKLSVYLTGPWKQRLAGHFRWAGVRP